MKLLFILGDAAVGKMTVGHELMKITELRLFHNHMTIEPVIEILGKFDQKTISEIGTDFYYVELIAPQEIRLKRNVSENRLKNKASKRDIVFSNQRLIDDDKNHRCVSYEGEIVFDNYLRIDNSDMEPDKVAGLIKETFNL